MNAKWTFWNKFAVALTSIMLIWAISPVQNCICQPETVSVSHSSQLNQCCNKACCQAESEKSIESKPECGSAFQNMSCCCAPASVVLRQWRFSKVLPENESAGSKPASSAKPLSENDGQYSLFRLVALRNDELKPDRVFLLKRALLN